MEWIVIGFLVVALARLGESGAIRCQNGSQGDTCTTEEKEIGPPLQIAEEGKEKTVLKSECVAGSEWDSNCTFCRCSESGVANCLARYPCDDAPNENQLKSTNKNGSIDVNSSLSRKVRGVPPQETPKKCSPSQEFRIDCNKCLCDPDGTTFSCTRFDCLAPPTGLNVATRTKREVTTSENITMECTAGSVFNRDCNVCRCADGGKFATCTVKRCQLPKNKDDLPAPDSDPGFRCDPGEQFRRECNDCTCSADGKSVFCTLRLCDADTIPGI